MKTCTKCGVEKSLDAFHRNAKGSHGRYSVCKECRNASRINSIQYIHEYLSTHPCVDCGESDPIVLEFDHVRGVKKEKVSHRARISLQAVKEEIAKCDVRCANCHRRKTGRQLGYYRDTL